MAIIFFGTPEDVKEGDIFSSRKELIDASIHRSTMHGIDGNGNEGVAAIVLSGGYEDDKDFGDEIIYTGHGGNDPQTGKQVADQSWSDHGNKGLVVSEIRQLPVRVIRGYNHNSPFSPKSGYKYCGFFRVVDHWEESGKGGYKICRFKLIKQDSLLNDSSDIVSEGTLVKLEPFGKEPKWFSVGVDAPLQIKSQKISVTGNFAQQLIGKKVNDFINFGEGFKILEIKSY